MRIPAIKGLMDRRILVNYSIDPSFITPILPPIFRPKLVQERAIAGICLIRFKNLRPQFFPVPWGVDSENAAHRIAVEWDSEGKTFEGVYIPRRDTNSWFNTVVGGALFPGLQHRASFTVKEGEDHFSININSRDNHTRVSVSAHLLESFPKTSVFSSLEEASDFFKSGSLGYSTTQSSGRFDGIELRCEQWKVYPLGVEEVHSSFFEDTNRFPKDSVRFDNALLMRGLQHQWVSHKDLCCAVG